MKQASLCIALIAALALTGCASPRVRLAAGLESAGLSPRMAGCMSDRMVDRLSLLQLRRLQSLGSLPKADMTRLSIDEFLYKVRALRDHEILEVSSKAALACAIGL